MTIFRIGEMPPNGRELALDAINGWHVPNLRPLYDLDPTQKYKARVIFQQTNPDAKLMSDSALYNCMGFAFASRRTIIDIDLLDDVLRADGYVRISNQDELGEGDLVVYTLNNRAVHVGIITTKIKGYQISVEKIIVLSKWGQLGEYVHELNDVPELYGRAMSFWRQYLRS